MQELGDVQLSSIFSTTTNSVNDFIVLIFDNCIYTINKYARIQGVNMLCLKMVHRNRILVQWRMLCILVFPKWITNSVNSANSGNPLNHRRMNWAEFKDPHFYMYLADAVMPSLSLTQEVAGSNKLF